MPETYDDSLYCQLEWYVVIKVNEACAFVKGKNYPVTIRMFVMFDCHITLGVGEHKTYNKR